MIVAAAIRLADGRVFSVPKPGRHCDVIRAIKAARATHRVTSENEEGFLTDAGDFVDRKEAGRLAIACGQIKELGWPNVGLFSEDVW